MSLVVGAAIAALGLGIRAVASGHVDKNEELAMTGPYAYVRNPLYLGSIVIAVGFAVAARDVVIASLIVVMFALIYVPTIRSEEHYLRTRFPEYSAYAACGSAAASAHFALRRNDPGLLARALLKAPRVQCLIWRCRACWRRWW